MANIIGDIIQDVKHRIGEFTNVPPYHNASILRAINRIYRRLNSELKCLEKSYDIAAGTFESVSYMSKPSDMIMPFKFTNSDGDVADIDYVAAEVFDSSNGIATFTVMGDKLYFSSVNSESSFTMWYYSAGFVLVDANDEDVETGEANTPEWQAHYHDALFYGACIELKQDYALFRSDAVEFERMKSQLRESHYRKQMGVTPEIIGGIGRSGNLDDYDVMGLR